LRFLTADRASELLESEDINFINDIINATNTITTDGIQSIDNNEIDDEEFFDTVDSPSNDNNDDTEEDEDEDEEDTEEDEDEEDTEEDEEDTEIEKARAMSLRLMRNNDARREYAIKNQIIKKIKPTPEMTTEDKEYSDAETPKVLNITNTTPVLQFERGVNAIRNSAFYSIKTKENGEAKATLQEIQIINRILKIADGGGSVSQIRNFKLRAKFEKLD
jgi:hypothetical protein